MMGTAGRVRGETDVGGDHINTFSAQEESGVCIRGGTLINRKECVFI